MARRRGGVLDALGALVAVVARAVLGGDWGAAVALRHPEPPCIAGPRLHGIRRRRPSRPTSGATPDTGRASLSDELTAWGRRYVS